PHSPSALRRLPPLTPSFFFVRTRPPPRSPLFPYTTLFRSGPRKTPTFIIARGRLARRARRYRRRVMQSITKTLSGLERSDIKNRSEEHTSELQSLTNLVCRLLLEKKKKHTQITYQHIPTLI